jgi:hypothetical protein
MVGSVRRRALAGLLATGLLLLVAGAAVVATHDGEEDDITMLTVPKVTETDLIHGMRASEVVAWAERSRMFWAVRNAPAFAASAEPHLLDNYRVTRQSPRPGAVKLPRFSGHPNAWRESSRQARKEKRDAPEVPEAVPAGVPA